MWHHHKACFAVVPCCRTFPSILCGNGFFMTLTRPASCHIIVHIVSMVNLCRFCRDYGAILRPSILMVRACLHCASRAKNSLEGKELQGFKWLDLWDSRVVQVHPAYIVWNFRYTPGKKFATSNLKRLCGGNASLRLGPHHCMQCAAEWPLIGVIQRVQNWRRCWSGRPWFHCTAWFLHGWSPTEIICVPHDQVAQVVLPGIVRL